MEMNLTSSIRTEVYKGNILHHIHVSKMDLQNG
jgi:hypothetical protein